MKCPDICYTRIWYVFCPNLSNIRKCRMFERMCSVQTYVTYENMICPNLCFEQKYDALCPILCYIWKYVISWHMLHINIKCVLSVVHTKKHYVPTFCTHENLMFLVQNDVTYDNVICPNLGYPRKYVFCPNIYWIELIMQHVNGSISVWICGVEQSIWDILLNYSQRIFDAQWVTRLAEI